LYVSCAALCRTPQAPATESIYSFVIELDGQAEGEGTQENIQISANNASAQANNFMNFLMPNSIAKAGRQRTKKSQLRANE
jgi:hypothetical protein